MLRHWHAGNRTPNWQFPDPVLGNDAYRSLLSPKFNLDYLKTLKIQTLADEGMTNQWRIDPIQVPIGLVTRVRAKRFKETLNGLIQHIWAKEHSC